ncbi:12-oxophytodienoate 7 [Cyphellophora attinorum]|uniref:12-oxophytodienoate 7 n=1 Tax=Cyphellophora attinorum TaxID=1664694 RepID=A0A0N1NVQ4_9EURO|nr:12-oxophytodienoate 7 [Phialophora attinorum]KPI34673.1 12-oxophytodienoate 7 [Phialophora attinorum]
MSALLQPLTMPSGIRLPNRLAMASMTRNRCVDNHKPGPATVQYYCDRARNGPGIIISEGLLVDWAGVDYPHAPFLVADEQAAAWKKVVDGVHREGRLMYWQAWHAGVFAPSFPGDDKLRSVWAREWILLIFGTYADS